MKYRRLTFLLCCTLIVSALFAGCQGKNTKFTKTGLYFDTVVSITLYGPDGEEQIDQCFRLCQQLEQTLSRTLETSEIWAINNRPAGTTEMEVSEDTAALIKAGLSFSRLSGGAFDITIAPLSELWDFKAENPSVPEEEQIQSVLKSVGYEAISLEENTLHFTSDNTKIDLGAVAKGYIADKLKQYLEAQGVKSGLLDLGGNILCIGSRPDGRDYTIGIQDPFGNQNEAILTLSLSDKSVVTSGVYERCFTQNGVLYHHLLNPDTGYPFDNGLVSVTILSDSSLDGDGYSTTCFALGLEKGMELIDETDGVEAIFITEDGQIHYSQNAAQYVIR